MRNNFYATRFDGHNFGVEMKKHCMEADERINKMLNELIRINQDRAAGYEKVIEQLPGSNIDLKLLFKQFIFESEQNADKLSSFVMKNGGQPSSSTTVSGKIYRMWMQVRLEITGVERISVLNACEVGEDAAQHAYTHALESEVQLPANIRNVIAAQRLALKSAHDEIKYYRDLLIVEAEGLPVR